MPILVVIITGVLLLLKKEFEWIQPSTARTEVLVPEITFAQIFERLNNLDQVKVESWQQVKRIDVRPSKGVIKIKLNDNTEVQMNPRSGEIIKVAARRSDVIESIHDGSFFHSQAKLWLFLPAAILLLVLWITGIYLFVITERARRRSYYKRKTVQRKLRLTNTNTG